MSQQLRPLVPRTAPDQQNPNTPDSGSNGSKRQLVSRRKHTPTACGLCRRRKTRCGGERPICFVCIRHGSSAECTYETKPAETQSQALKRKYSAAEGENTVHRRFVDILRSHPAQDVNNILGRLRGGASVDELVRHIESGDMLLELSVAPEVQWRHNPGGLLNIPDLLKTANNPYVKSIIYQIKFNSSSTAIPQSSPGTGSLALYNAPYHTATMVSTLLDTCEPSKWTTVSTDDELLREILRRYFTSVYMFLPFFDKDSFLYDMARGRNRFCSSLLVNAVLASGYRACPTLPDRHEFSNPSLLQYKFLSEARRLRELEAGESSITGIQTDMILHLEHGMNGQDKLGWSLCIAAVASAQELGLFDGYTPTMSKAQRTVRTMTAWALFAWQGLQSYHQEKPPLLTSPPSISLPTGEDAFGEIWIKYAASQSPLPVHFSNIFIALARFRTILNRISDRLNSPVTSQQGMDINETTMIYRQLQDWYTWLPSYLNAHNLVFPTHFNLHMHYWLVVERLFAPYTENNCFNILATSEVNPRKIIDEARICMRTLIRLYYSSHGDDGYDLFGVLIAQHVAFSALATIQQVADRTLKEINDSDALISACILRGQGRMSTLSDIVLKVLYKSAPLDLASKIYRFTNFSEDDNSSTPFMPLQAEWPIYVGQVSRKDERRLGNLFRAISELSADNRDSDEEEIVDFV
ncbi:hypothetical protein EDB82DRAFT_578349 [Fusarium venenatum]|uniref:uncharacterized protein n=1 Tax=Fusarium venenatum TaxID=56646 RepID=UPI001D4EE944|nr:hypothetical protein EDB82DRAFT_578349 [Fusarium venenatum]